MADDIPRQVRRKIESTANVRGLDLKDIQFEEKQDDGDVYRVIVNDPDAEEGENPTFFVLRPDAPGGLNMFGERLEKKMSAVRKKILGVEDETDQKLQETREQLEESGHPGANNGDVEYGPGPRPNLEGVGQGYSDKYVTTRSTTEADLPDPEDYTVEEETASDSGEQTRNEQMADSTEAVQNTHNTQETQDMQDIDTSDLYGEIADTAFDARDLEEKGHDRAVAALLEEIKEDVEDYLEGYHGDE